MDMKSTKKKLLQTPAAKQRRKKYAQRPRITAKWVTEHPAIPEGVKPAKKNQYHERLGVTADYGNEPKPMGAVATNVILVIGLGILCWTAYQLAYLFATPCVCP